MSGAGYGLSCRAPDVARYRSLPDRCPPDHCDQEAEDGQGKDRGAAAWTSDRLRSAYARRDGAQFRSGVFRHRATGCADPFDLDRGLFHGEPGPGGGIGEGFPDPAVFQFLGRAATLADQELRTMAAMSAVIAFEHVAAADEGRQTLDTMDQALVGQEIERAIDCGRSGAPVLVTQTVKEIIGTDGRAALQDQAKNETADIGQPGASIGAELLCPVEQDFDRRIERVRRRLRHMLFHYAKLLLPGLNWGVYRAQTML